MRPLRRNSHQIAKALRPALWKPKNYPQAFIDAATIGAHASVLGELLEDDAFDRARTGEPREVFARDTMAALDATVASLREALGVAPGFSGAEQ